MGRRSVPQGLSPRALPRFFVSPAVLEARVLPDEIAHQVRHVLRLRSGDWICLLDGTGGVFLAMLDDDTRIADLHPSTLETELPFRITVLQSFVRSEKAETVVRLCVQGGAAALSFAPSNRSVVHWDAQKQARYATRWQKIAQEEAELACRAYLPRVRLFDNWRHAFVSLPRPVFVLDEWEGALLLKQRCRRMPLPSTLSLVVGPEGGFSPAERDWMAAQPETYAASLGARVLRTEHAAFYALAQIATLWE
ncbi:MAG: ribosomal RNA small subunit methyltransferase E [Fimbriimonadales bacterium]|nr:MAG: ribosomal RNA small subunit methyltransferase E [Fimbriimonadales bacterium]